MRLFLGLQVGHSSLSAQLLQESGQPEARVRRRLGSPAALAGLIAEALEELRTHPHWEGLAGFALALEKSHRCGFSSQPWEALLPPGCPWLLLPSLQASLLGAYPWGPSLLLNLGADLRLAALDATHTYREFRLQEGGGRWWCEELVRLAEHSPRLRQRLGDHPPDRLLRRLPDLLQIADYPSPDPVLKARLDGLTLSIANSCLALSSRLQGVSTLTGSGYLEPSPLGLKVKEACSGSLRLAARRFPPEVGSALLALALDKENQERRWLGKPLESGQAPTDRWTASPTVVRRLFRLRRPFEAFPEGER